MKVLLNSFHLNGHTLGFHPQTQKLVSVNLLTQGLTLGVKRVKSMVDNLLERLLTLVWKMWWPG